MTQLIFPPRSGLKKVCLLLFPCKYVERGDQVRCLAFLHVSKETSPRRRLGQLQTNTWKEKDKTRSKGLDTVRPKCLLAKGGSRMGSLKMEILPNLLWLFTMYYTGFPHVNNKSKQTVFSLSLLTGPHSLSETILKLSLSRSRIQSSDSWFLFLPLFLVFSLLLFSPSLVSLSHPSTCLSTRASKSILVRLRNIFHVYRLTGGSPPGPAKAGR